jgi:prepilin-type N-terminal cleavage/methylation domain-containing protein
MKLRNSTRSGFTLVEVMIVVGVIGMLASIAVPSYVRARDSSQMNACINNLREFDGAVQQYALESKLAPTAPYTLANLQPFLKLTSAGALPSCPAGGSYSPGESIAEHPTCSLSPIGHNLP